ncbi:hypothetical protein MMC28_009067 [Mycoblastus sanguinarius]|nr:hypothetical protein [Mycoblastus sanguinarius]
MTTPISSRKDSATGLLSTARIDVGPPAESKSHYAEGGTYSSPVEGHHTAYFDNWNSERQKAVARGEDPNPNFQALVAAREEKMISGRLRKWWKDKTGGKKAHGEALTAEEERQAIEKDKEREH